MKKAAAAAMMAMSAAGCQRDLIFGGVDLVSAVPNPPNLETPVKTDVITQVTTPKVDILWVIDDSGSMSEEQQQLIESFPAFMQYFLDSGLDWHIGVVSTDMADNSKSGKLQGAGGVRYLDPDTPNPIELYNQMARLGINGSSDEMGRRAAMKALTDPLLNGFNQGFYRDEASLSVIVISDEPDYSGTEPTANEFINFLNALKPDAEDVEFSSIVAPEQGCALASYPGTDYIRVTNAVGGLFQNICSADWVPMLDALGLQAAGLKREYFLSELPIEDTIQVWVEDDGFIYDGIDRARIEAGEDPSDLCESGTCFEYTYEPVRNSILMYDYIPNPLAKINIHYELLSEYEPQAGDESL